MNAEKPEATSNRIVSLIPAPLGWETYLRAVANILLVGLVAVGGEWSVHQLEYRIEYGSRFGAVMASTPHRLYMAPWGATLGSTLLLITVLFAGALGVWSWELRSLSRRLPPAAVGRLSRSSGWLPLRSILVTALLLACAQVLLYFIQENLEWNAVMGSWPGLAVLLAPQHATVLPLHLLVALGSAAVLWIACGRVRQARGAVCLARRLTALTPPVGSSRRPIAPPRVARPNRPRSGSLRSRAPPLAA